MKRIMAILLCALLVCNFVLPVYATGGDVSENTNETVDAKAEVGGVSGSGSGDVSDPEIVPDSQQNSSPEGTNTSEQNPTPPEGTNTSEQNPTPAEGTNTSEQNPIPPESEETGESEESETNSSDGVLLGNDLFSSLMAQDSAEGLIETIISLTEEQIASLSEEQITQVENHVDAIFPPVSSTVGDTLVAGDETITGPSEIRIPTYDFTNVAPFGEPAKGITRMLFAARSSSYALQNDEPEDNGLETSKRFDYKDGSNSEGTITLEAWATGEYSQTSVSKEVPTDIILVLDQSGSMDDQFDNITEENYTVLNNTNLKNYALRQNGGSDNIWYKLEDGSFVRVNMTVTSEASVSDFIQCKDNIDYYSTLTNPKNVELSEQGRLYQLLDDGTYAKVTVVGLGTKGFLGIYSDGYDYYYPDGVVEHVDTGNHTTNVSIDRFYYTNDVVTNTYRYFYLDADGKEIEIETSVGDDANPQNTYYSLQTTQVNRTKLQALKAAVSGFTEAVAKKAQESDVNHRIAVVGFASGKSWNGRDYDYGNTEVFVGSTQYKYGAAAQSKYSSAFMDMNDSNDVAQVYASINALDGDGGTLTNLGLEMANGIFKQNPVDSGTQRNRVVIVFTDGQPGWSGYDSSVAKSAVDEADISKNTYQATVYTVGIFEGANVNGTDNTNTFMRNMATSGEGYYLTASDSEALNDIFEKISEQIQSGGSKITLGEETVIKDVMSDYFRLPESTDVDNIKVYTVGVDPLTGAFLNDRTEFVNAQIVVDHDTQTVTVTNFDFSENWVGPRTVNGETTYQGKKLVIEVPCKVRDGFLGGSDVPTNAETSGVYKASGDNEPFEAFDVPKADVEIPEITVNAEVKNVYLYGDLTKDDLASGSSAIYDSTYNVVDVYKRANDDDDSNDPWEDDFVTITRTVSPESFTDLTADTTYSLTYTVTDSSNETNFKRGSAENVAVNVFKPVVTWQDTVVEIGEVVNFKVDNSTAKQNYVSTVWKHGDTFADSSMGDAPTLAFTYDQISGIDYSEETKVDVLTVTLDGHEILAIHDPLISFEHVNCDFENCSWDDELDSGLGGAEFIIHINAFDLTINKLGVNEDLDPDAPFIFNISGNGIDMNVVIYGNGSVTIKDIPAGDYTVTEVGGYWRYSLTSSNPVNGVVNAKNSTITFTNARDEAKWLDNVTNATNDFDSVTNHVSPSNND